jgi:hypothetical protein
MGIAFEVDDTRCLPHDFEQLFSAVIEVLDVGGSVDVRKAILHEFPAYMCAWTSRLLPDGCNWVEMPVVPCFLPIKELLLEFSRPFGSRSHGRICNRP